MNNPYLFSSFPPLKHVFEALEGFCVSTNFFRIIFIFRARSTQIGRCTKVAVTKSAFGCTLPRGNPRQICDRDQGVTELSKMRQ